MSSYPLYTQVTEIFDFPSLPDTGSVTARLNYEWGDLIDTMQPSGEGTIFTVQVPADLIVAAGLYNIRWGAEFDGSPKYFNTSFSVEEQYISEAEFMDAFEDMNTSEYSGDIFERAERVSRKIIDTYCGQNFQYVGSKTLSKEGGGSEKLYIGKPIIHIDSVFIGFDDRSEDYTDLAEVDWASKYAIRCQKKFPSGSKVSVTADWGWAAVPVNIKEATALLVVDMLEDTRREHHRYGITRLYQDTNRLEFDPSMFGESTGNLDVDVLLMDYVYWIPDWI
jgi:hypothetical protein